MASALIAISTQSNHDHTVKLAQETYKTDVNGNEEPSAGEVVLIIVYLFLVYGLPAIACCFGCWLCYKCQKKKNQQAGSDLRERQTHTKVETVIEKEVTVEQPAPAPA